MNVRRADRAEYAFAGTLRTARSPTLLTAPQSGDLAVGHPNSYIEIKDRLKVIIISGGTNIWRVVTVDT
jgi:acyl-CoA synthetase (AMP-forming)/AMP-acid ligase II